MATALCREMKAVYYKAFISVQNTLLCVLYYTASRHIIMSGQRQRPLYIECRPF